MISPFFINNHEKQCGRVQLFNDCWLEQYNPQCSNEANVTNFKDANSGYFTIHKGKVSGTKFYEFKDIDDDRKVFDNCLSIRRKSYLYKENDWTPCTEN